MSNTLNGNSNVLCIGSKNGHIVQLLSKEVNTCGIENSSSMITMSKYKYPDNIYLNANYLDADTFKSNKFTHVILPMMTINIIEDIDRLFNNIEKWLVHNGYLIIMLLDLDNIRISDLVNTNPSSFFKNTFDYDIQLNKNNITDRIRNKKGYERTDIQYLYPHKEDKIIYNAQVNGIKYKYSKQMNSIKAKLMYFQRG
jgi:SAM-dependent methyltransferase